MKLTDTHCHLTDPVFQNILPDVIKQAEQQNVCRFIVPSAHAGEFTAVAALNTNPNIQTAFGIHPWFAEQADDSCFGQLEHHLQQFPQAWLGEIGLDFHHAKTPETRALQEQVFRRQLQIAQTHRRRVILHNLKSSAALIAAVKDSCFDCGGIVHAFSGSLEEAAQFIRHGFKIGIGSLLLNPTAKKARQAAQSLDLHDIVLETDSPFMLKNETNTPANVRKIAQIVADLRGISVEEVAEQTEQNVDKLLTW